MNLLVFAVRDNAAEVYMQPWTAPSRGAAIRSFKDAVNSNQDTPIAKHPQDHVLFHIGEYDDNSGRLVPLDAPYSLGVGIDFKEAANG